MANNKFNARHGISVGTPAIDVINSDGQIVGELSGNASTATALSNSRTIAITGDISYTSGSFNGTSDVTGTATLANSGVTAGVYGSSSAIPVITVDSKGRLTSASTTSLTVPTLTSQLTNDSGFATTSYVDTSVSNLVASSPAALDTLNELAAALGNDANFATTTATSLGLKAVKTTTISAGTGLTGGGDLSANRTLSLETSGVTAGTYNNVTVDVYGRATAGSNTAYLTAVTPSNFSSQTANTVLAAPNGSAGAPTFRAIVGADIPTLNQNTTGSAATLTTGRTIALTGDVAYTSGSFNGSANATGTATLASVGTAGTYTKVTTDAKGRVTSGTTLSASDIPSLDASKITSGTIDAARLPSYVDDVIEGTNLAAFPATGETGKIYIALDTNKTYRWSGSAYVYITSGAVDSVGGYTGVVTAANLLAALVTVDGAGSGLDADLLDGNSAAAFYLATNPSGYTTNVGTVTSVAALTIATAGTDVTSTVATGTTTPVITLNIPTASAANRGALSAADWTTFNNKQVAGTYATGTGTASGTNTGDNAVNSLYSGLVSNATHTGDVNGSTALTLATVNSNVGTWNTVTVNGKGLVTAGSNTAYLTAVTATAPVASSGGTTPVISMAAATASVNGYMTSTYAAKLDGIAAGATTNTGTVTSVAALTIGTTGTDVASTVATGTTTPVITLNIPTASAVNRGALSSADWTTFNNKVGSLTDTLATVTGRGATTATASTFSGGLTASGGLTVSGGWTYLGQYNTQAYPTAGKGLALSFNWSAGNVDQNVWNTTDPVTYTGTGIRFMQLLTASTFRDLMFMRQDGALSFGGINNIGTVGQVLQSNAAAAPTWVNHVSTIAATTPILTSAATGAITLSHATSGVTAGTYNNVTVNTFGHVTAGSNTAYLTAESDTLATVTARGATTSTASTFSGGITHSGLTMTAGTNVDQIYTASDVLTLTTAWQDTSVNAAELVTGSYMVQVYADDSAVGGGQYMTYYTGIMSWYGGDTNEASSDEIVLHRAGHASTTGNIFLRVLRTMTADTNNMKLQIAGITANTGTSTYTYKFRRLI